MTGGFGSKLPLNLLQNYKKSMIYPNKTCLNKGGFCLNNYLESV